MYDVLLIDPVAVGSTNKEIVDWYGEAVGARLFPIGLADRGHLLLMMAEDGRFFAGFDDYLGYAGNSGAELFGRIRVSALEQVPVPED